MSFLTVIESAASDVETTVVNGLKDAVGYVDNTLVVDFIPELESALMAALKNFTQQEIAIALSAIKAAV